MSIATRYHIPLELKQCLNAALASARECNRPIRVIECEELGLSLANDYERPDLPPILTAFADGHIE